MKRIQHGDLDEENLWINRAMGGDNHAFEKLLSQYRCQLFRYLLAICSDNDAVEDIIQETYFKIYKSINQYRYDGSFKAWVFSIARNTWKNYLRGEHAERYDRTYDVYKNEIASGELVENEVMNQELLIEIKNAMSCLPDRQQKAVRMRLFNQEPFGVIASKMKCSVSTAKTNHYIGIGTISRMITSTS